MTEKIEVATHSGPIRVRVSASEPVKARALSAPIAIKVLGMPGPTGETGAQGPTGPQGPPGNLDAGVTIDGGNY